MNTTAIIGLITLFVTSMVKFAFGVPAALVGYKMNFIQGFVFALLAGICGVLVFLFLSNYVIGGFNFVKGLIIKPSPLKRKKIFTTQRRRLVSIKAKYGLIGLAFITPCIISIPVGTILAMRFYHNKWRVFSYMAVSVAFWSALFSLIFTVIV